MLAGEGLGLGFRLEALGFGFKDCGPCALNQAVQIEEGGGGCKSSELRALHGLRVGGCRVLRPRAWGS